MRTRRRRSRSVLLGLATSTLLVTAVACTDDDGFDDAAEFADSFDDEFDDDGFDDGFDDEFDDDGSDEDFDDEFDDEDFDDGFDDEFDDDEFDDDEFDEGVGDEGFGDDFDDEGVDAGDDGEPSDDDDDGDVGDTLSTSDDAGVGPASGRPADERDEILAELLDEGFCDPADVEGDGVVTAMHFVADGEVQPACHTDDGADDPRLLEAWTTITEIAPVELYDDVSLLAGYEGTSDTLAFVTTLDEQQSFFLLAVDVSSAEQDPDELRLTMMHELTHVFVQLPGTQLDVTVTDASECDTFFNGAGCFTDGSYLDEWVDEFWSSEMLEAL
ncbi:MAG: hypothetical protein AAGG08_11060, partial [Actinomycetota bacterium]